MNPAAQLTPQPPRPPLIIPKRSVITLAPGHTVTRQRFNIELPAQTLADVQWLIRKITVEQTQEQIGIDNPPQLVLIDGRTQKSLADLKAKSEVTFGVRLAREAMRIVEQRLFAAIRDTTKVRSGRLSTSTNWVWTYVTGGTVKRITSPDEITSFSTHDRLVLMPEGVPHATVVNSKVSRGGRLFIAGKATKKNPTATPAKKNQKLGFFAFAIRPLKSRPEFNAFDIYIAFTRRFAIPGELSRRQGTGMIVIRPKLKPAR